MRLFLAISIPLKVKQQLNTQLEFLRKDYPEFQWEPFENYHINIHFIGAVESEQKDLLIKKIQDILFDKDEFYLYSLGLELYMHNRILMYVTFQREKKLEYLADAIKNTLAPHEEKISVFVPHLTFARYKIPSKQQYFLLKKKLEKADIDISFAVSHIVLFNGIKKIKSFTLQKENPRAFTPGIS